jgi:hypothetical protein
MKTFFTTGGVFAILLFFLSLGSIERGERSATIEDQPRTPPRPLAIVRRFRPMVQIRDTGNVEWVEAKVAFQLFDKEEIAKNLYRPKMSDDQKQKFELFFTRLFNHPFWDQNDPTIDKALGAATSVKDIFDRQGLNSEYIRLGS